MKSRRSRLVFLVACVISSLILGGLFFFYQDLQSLISERRLMVSHGLDILAKRIDALQTSSASESQALEASLVTAAFKDAQATSSYPIDYCLVDLKLKSVLQGRCPYWLQQSQDLVVPQDAPSRIDWVGGQFLITAVRPMSPNQILVAEANVSAYLYRLMGILLHYLIFAVALSLVVFFLLNRILEAKSGSQKKNSPSILDTPFRSLFEQTSDAVLLLDLEGRIIQANEAAAVILQCQLSKLILRKLIDTTSTDFTFVTLGPSRDVLSETIHLKRSFRSKAKIILADQRIRYVSFSSTPFDFEADRLAALVVFHEITEDIVREQELEHKQNQLSKENEKLQEQVITDPLTRCLNKQYLIHFLERRDLRWLAGEGCSMLLIDIDDFKKVNDTRGHDYGDEVLKNLGEFFNSFFRRTDKVIRYGGDEFIVLLPQTDLQITARIANNLIQGLKKAKFEGSEFIQISIGIAQLRTSESGQDWFQRADAALYDAKSSGKSTVRGLDLPELEILNA